MQRYEELLVINHFSFPGLAVNFFKFLKLLFRKCDSIPSNILEARYPADGCFAAPNPAVYPVYHPL